MSPDDLDTLVDEELRQLPSPRAPQTLLPRVMAAVEHWSRRPWYAREWVTWPIEWQIASITALVLLLAAGTLLVPSAQATIADVLARLMPGALHGVGQTAQRLDAAINAGRVVWRAVLEPLAPYVTALVVLMWLACAAFGTALNRVVFGRP